MEILLLTQRPELTYKLEILLEDFLINKNLNVESTDTNLTFLLGNILIKNQNHIDLILIDDYKEFETGLLEGYSTHNHINNCIKVVRFLKNNSSETYSNSNYYLKNLPIIKICKEHEDVTYTEKAHVYFDYCLEDRLVNYLLHSISKAIAYTRDIIAEDLKTLGMMSDNQFHLIKTNFALYHYEKDLKILSKAFVERKKSENHYWFEYPIDEIEDAINRYLEIITISRQYNKREEKRIHTFLRENPYFILRDSYSQFYYDKKLDTVDKQFSIKPDFILRPIEYKIINKTEILEIKLPDEQIVKKKRFHQNFYSDFWEHLTQIKDYQDYFFMPEVKEEILRKLGYLPSDYLFTLLVSGIEHKEQNRDVIDKLARQFNFKDVNILTYDELLEYQKRYYEREKVIRSFTKYKS